MKYFLFLDESGDHGLKNIDPNFPIFLLCGVLIREDFYEIIKAEMNTIKNEFWNDINVIFHSRDIRKCNDPFDILFDNKIKSLFYDSINELVSKNNYTIIAAAINKAEFIKQYGKL